MHLKRVHDGDTMPIGLLRTEKSGLKGRSYRWDCSINESDAENRKGQAAAPLNKKTLNDNPYIMVNPLIFKSVYIHHNVSSDVIVRAFGGVDFGVERLV